MVESTKETVIFDVDGTLVEAFPQVRELVERIQRDGKRVVPASSAKQDELDHFRR